MTETAMIHDAGALICHAWQQNVMGKLLCTLPCGMWSVWGRHNIVYEVSVVFFLLTVWSKFVWSIEMNFYLKRIKWITKLQRFMVVFSQEQLIIILSWHHLLLTLADVQYKLVPLVESSHKDMLTSLMLSHFRLSKVVKKKKKARLLKPSVVWVCKD